MHLIFMGTPSFAVPSLEKLIEAGHEVVAVVTQPDRPKGRGQKFAASPIKEVALQRGLRVEQPASVNTPDFVERLRSWQPELIVVVAFGQILKKAVLEIPRLGCVNVHASLLPKYRGAAPIHRAVINGETVTGVTIMFMNERMDAGDLLLRREVAIDDEDTVGVLEPKLATVGADLLVESLQHIRQGTATRLPQDDAEATFAPMLKKEDGRIDWAQPYAVIRNLVRGMHPHPGAFTQHNGRLLKVGKVTRVTAEQSAPAPGEIVACGADGFPRVQTGEGILRLDEVQPQDRKWLSGDAWARGSRIRQGERLS